MDCRGVVRFATFRDVRERVLVNGRKLDEAAWAELGNAGWPQPGGRN
jgi:hypothetical protein